jgi:hypothetical protein
MPRQIKAVQSSLDETNINEPGHLTSISNSHRDARVAELFLSVIHARFFLSWAIAEEEQRPQCSGYWLRSSVRDVALRWVSAFSSPRSLLTHVATFSFSLITPLSSHPGNDRAECGGLSLIR